MVRRTKAVLLVGSLAVAMAVATVFVLTGALGKAIDPQHYCDTGFSRLSNCTYHWSSKTISQSTPIFTSPSNATSTVPSGSRDTFRPTSDVTSWAVADCPGITSPGACSAPRTHRTHRLRTTIPSPVCRGQALACHDGEEFNLHQGFSCRDAARSGSRAPLLSPRVEQARLVGEWRRGRRAGRRRDRLHDIRWAGAAPAHPSGRQDDRRSVAAQARRPERRHPADARAGEAVARQRHG